jgi:photosystem II stability/assembly factor-like uncharacterized protein
VRAGTVILIAVALLLAGCGSGPTTSQSASPGSSPNNVAGDSAWVAGVAPSYVLTNSGAGGHWVSRRLPGVGPEFVRAVAFANARAGWVVGGAGMIFASTDGGATWARQASGVTGDLVSVACTDAKHAWALSPSGQIAATSDGGATWRRQSVGARHTGLEEIAFADPAHGWAVGNTDMRGAIYATVDGGAHWKLQYALRGPGGVALYSVAFGDARYGWVVGGPMSFPVSEVQPPNFILTTSDGGAHWTTQYKQARDYPVSVTAVGARDAWAVGTTGLILATHDGGATWVRQRSGTSLSLGGVAFSDVAHGWVICGHDAILSTSDGGASWTPVDTPRLLPSEQHFLSVSARSGAAGS